MGLHPPKPIRKTKERICTQKPIKRFRHKANCRVHRHASDFRQSYRSGFAKVGVVSSNLIARSKNSLKSMCCWGPFGPLQRVWFPAISQQSNGPNCFARYGLAILEPNVLWGWQAMQFFWPGRLNAEPTALTRFGRVLHWTGCCLFVLVGMGVVMGIALAAYQVATAAHSYSYPLWPSTLLGSGVAFVAGLVVRGGSVSLNRFRGLYKWISASVMLRPGLAAAG